MPKEFRFTIDGELHFRCKIHATQCTGTTKQGARCKRKCIIGFEYCPAHMASTLKLAIRNSTLDGAGKGLFAFDRAARPDDVVFRDGDRIARYNGQLINAQQLQDRYGGYTAPYGVQVNTRQVIDCACKRGVGSLGNTRPAANNATLSVNTRDKTASVKATRTIRNGQEVFISYGCAYRFDDETSHRTVPVK
eukprot:gene25540-30837_t